MAGSPPPTDIAMEDDDNYVSSEDEDFDPTNDSREENVSASSDEEDDAGESGSKSAPKAKAKQQRKKKGEEAEDLGFENSGDEGIIKKGMKRKRKGSKGNEDSGGEGGFVKTRSMRVVEEEEKKKPLANAEGATIDVEALWKSMNLGEAPNISTPPTMEIPDPTSPATPPSDDQKPPSTNPTPAPVPPLHLTRNYREDLITIPFTRLISDIPTTLHKTILRSSPEAQTYLSTHPTSPPLPRSIPRRRTSKWDPNPDGTIRGLPSDIVQTDSKLILLDVHQGQRLKVTPKSHLPDWPPPPNVPTMWEYNWRKGQQVGGAVKKWDVVVPAKGREAKMNVVDKSKMDWEAHVAEEGDQDELEQAAKAKGAYLDRVDFLGRTEDKREEELRAARMKK